VNGIRMMLSLILIALVGAVGLGPAIVYVTAQEGTPAASGTGDDAIARMELVPGVTAEVFAGVASARAPGQTVYLARFTFESGSEIFPHSHPGTTVLGVESGTFGWTLVEGTAHVTRGAAAGATGPAEEVVEPGVEVLLNVGDAIHYEDDVVHTARGAGDGPAVILGTLILEEGQQLLMPADMEMTGTPTS
jgi:quercetin dioxygenase-like cupin family protein